MRLENGNLPVTLRFRAISPFLLELTTSLPLFSLSFLSFTRCRSLSTSPFCLRIRASPSRSLSSSRCLLRAWVVYAFAVCWHELSRSKTSVCVCCDTRQGCRRCLTVSELSTRESFVVLKSETKLCSRWLPKRAVEDI